LPDIRLIEVLSFPQAGGVLHSASRYPRIGPDLYS
jgi:hypothetical protein